MNTDIKISEREEEDALYEHQRIVVDPGQSPLRIDKFLLTRMTNVTRNRIQQGIKGGSILVNGKSIKANHKIKPGEVITLTLANEPRGHEEVQPEKMDLDVRYEDEHILIIHKPAGLVVHPGVSNWSGTLVNGLAHYIGAQHQQPIMEGNKIDRPYLVHRIDKDTSGLLVVAKTESAMAHLAKQFYDHSIKREYYAIIWGEPDEDNGTIDVHIGRHPKDRLKQHYFPEGDMGKHAVTHYEMVERMYYVSLIKCQLETGRTHQIRVHLSSIGHPIFGDARYGGDKIVKGTVFSKYKQFVQNCLQLIPRQALHAKSLGFVHPATGEWMFFDSELPEDMMSVMDRWRVYLNARK